MRQYSVKPWFAAEVDSDTLEAGWTTATITALTIFPRIFAIFVVVVVASRSGRRVSQYN